ncbi:MAG TPA: hypothetical protein VG496_05425 [Myxococcales bacterium]|nr:hypothetical protein [Myxococcales bacterium]
MAKVAVVAVLFVVGFSRQAKAELSTFELGLFVAAETSLTVDMLQTTSAMHAGLRESNPLLGQHPSDGKIAAYFGGCMLATAAATYLLPDGMQGLPSVLVLMVQVPQIVSNGGVRWGFRLPF